MKVYVPFNDEALIYAAENMAESLKVKKDAVMIHGQGRTPLAEVTSNDTLYMIGHGRYSRGDQICGEVAGCTGTKWEYLTATELASRLASDGLTKAIGDVRLIMCWGGYSGDSMQFDGHELARKPEDAPFAGQLCAAMKQRNFTRIIVTGFTGKVLFPKLGMAKVKTGTIWMTDKDGNVAKTDDNGDNSLLDLLLAAQGGTGTLSNVHRTVWH
jgi:hypothetical protein